MIGDGFWSTGIRLDYRADKNAWGTHLSFHDGGFAGDDAPDDHRIVTGGTLSTRYHVVDGQKTDALTAVIDAIVRDAKALGIQFTDLGRGPALYVSGDGDDPDVDLPGNWRELVAAQCARLGWRNVYAPAEATQ